MKVSFFIKIPTCFEIEFFLVKMRQPVIHLTFLRLVKEMKNSTERIGNNLYEITEKTKRNLFFSVKIPTRFEIEFFSVKMHQPVIHLTFLRLVKEMKNSTERIGNNLYEITEKTKRNLFFFC